MLLSHVVAVRGPGGGRTVGLGAVYGLRGHRGHQESHMGALTASSRSFWHLSGY